MSFHTEVEVEISTDTVETLIVAMINVRREVQGNVFATAEEAEILKSDPLANIDIIRDELVDLADMRFRRGDATLYDWAVYGRRVCFTYRISQDRITELANAAIGIYLLPLAKQATKASNSVRCRVSLRQDLVKLVCQYIKTQLGMPSENRLGSSHEEVVRDLVGPAWTKATAGK